MTVINTNVGSLNARVAALKATANMERTMERLSSGKRINSAADDAAGLAVASKMEAQEALKIESQLEKLVGRGNVVGDGASNMAALLV